MYYSGFPFNEFSLITDNDISNELSYFVKRDVYSIFFEELYERILDGRVNLVVYCESNYNNQDLIKFHNDNYKDIPFFIENKIGFNVYKITMVVNMIIKGYHIIKYDEIWRVDIEQIFDQDHLLLEYRKLYYNGNNRIAYKEKTFFSSWNISEENFHN